jgi:O-antigen/teichoic acid export membrane protein
VTGGDERIEAGAVVTGGETMTASSAYSFAAQMATAAFTAVLTLVLVRVLGPTQYGTFALAIGIGTLIALPADLGISSSTARFVADHRADRRAIAWLLADAMRLKLIASGIACGVLIALSGRRVATDVRMVFGESAAEFSASIVLVVTVGGALGATCGRAVGYLCGAGFAMVLGARAFGWPAALRRRGRRSFGRRIGAYAVPLILVDSANTLFSAIDVLLIGAYLGVTKAGLFSAPYRLLILLAYPGNAIANGVAPRMSRGTGNAPDAAALERSLRGLIVFQSLLIAPLLVWAEPIVRILLGSGYAGSVTTLRVLSASAYLGGFVPLVSLTANYLGDARSRVPLMVGAALLNAVIDVVLIPGIGIVAGAIGTAAALAVMLVGHVHICRRHLDLPLAGLAWSALRGGLAATAMGAVLLMFGLNPSIPLVILGAVASVAVFFAILLVAEELTTSELAGARRWTGRLLSARR